MGYSASAINWKLYSVTRPADLESDFSWLCGESCQGNSAGRPLLQGSTDLDRYLKIQLAEECSARECRDEDGMQAHTACPETEPDRL